MEFLPLGAAGVANVSSVAFPECKLSSSDQKIYLTLYFDLNYSE